MRTRGAPPRPSGAGGCCAGCRAAACLPCAPGGTLRTAGRTDSVSCVRAGGPAPQSANTAAAQHGDARGGSICCSQPARLPAAQGAQKPGRSRGTLNRPSSQTRNASRQRVSSASSIASFLKPRMTSRATCPPRRAASAPAHAQNPRSANPRSTVPPSPGRHQERVLLGLVEAAHAALLQPGRAAALRDVHDLRYKHRHGLGREGRVEDLRPGPPVRRGSQA